MFTDLTGWGHAAIVPKGKSWLLIGTCCHSSGITSGRRLTPDAKEARRHQCPWIGVLESGQTEHTNSFYYLLRPKGHFLLDWPGLLKEVKKYTNYVFLEGGILFLEKQINGTADTLCWSSQILFSQKVAAGDFWGSHICIGILSIWTIIYSCLY